VNSALSSQTIQVTFYT